MLGGSHVCFFGLDLVSWLVGWPVLRREVVPLFREGLQNKPDVDQFEPTWKETMQEAFQPENGLTCSAKMRTAVAFITASKSSTS